jgi:hypothetical protein
MKFESEKYGYKPSISRPLPSETSPLHQDSVMNPRTVSECLFIMLATYYHWLFIKGFGYLLHFLILIILFHSLQ